jgi:rhamnosyltransferase
MIIAIIVTYKPNLIELSHLIDLLINQVDRTIIVHNGSASELNSLLADRNDPHVYPMPLGTNMGIATAHNAGIAWAKEQGAKYIVLFDQDSQPAPDMIQNLVTASLEMSEKGYAVAAIGPNYLDPRQNNPPPFIRIDGLKLERCACTTPDSIVPVDYVISSGCLIPISTLDAVGHMVDDLFIDYVDIEWGLRAKQLSYQSFGACNASMLHSLGENPIKFFGRQIPLHSPLRHYYHFRNAIWLYRQASVPLNWKLVDGWRLFLKYGFYTLFAQPRFKHFKMMTLGIWHGLRGRMGKLDDA